MITAEEARELSVPDEEKAEGYLKGIEIAIHAAVKNGKREVIMREKPFADWDRDWETFR